MRKAITITGLALGGLALILAVAVAVLRSMDWGEYRDLIAGEVKAATGRELDIAGRLRLDLSLNPALAVEGLRLANAPGGSLPDMVRLDRLEVQVELLPLLRGDVRIKRLILTGLDLLIEIDSAGHGNWHLDAPGADRPASGLADESPGRRLPEVQEVRLKDVNVLYRDGRTGQHMGFRLDRLDVATESADAPMRLDLVATAGGSRIAAKGEMGPVKDLVEGGRPFSINLKATAFEGDVDVAGTIAEPHAIAGLDIAVAARGESLNKTLQAAAGFVPELARRDLPELGPYAISARLAGSSERLALRNININAGRVDVVRMKITGTLSDALAAKGLDVTFNVEGHNLAPLVAIAGGGLPKLPPLLIAGRVRDAPSAYRLDELRIKAGRSSVEGRAAVTLDGPRPAFEAALAAPLVDLDELIPPMPAARVAAGSKRVFSADPLPLEALRVVDAKVLARAQRVAVRGLSVDMVVLDAALRGGVLDLKAANGSLARGTVAVTGRLDAGKPAAAAAGLELDAKGIDAGVLLKSLGLTDVLDGGVVEGRVRLAARGGSVRDLMGGLGGEAMISMGKARLRNADLNLAGADLASEAFTALNPFAKKEEVTNIDCGAMRFVVVDGIGNSDKGVAIETAKMNIVGSGTVNLKTEAIDFAIKPEARQGLGINLVSVASMVRIRGTLAEPSVGLDRLGAARGAASVGAALATGGLSLLAEGLIGRVTADEHACLTALGKAGPVSGRPSTPAPAGAVQGTSRPPAQAPSEDGIGGLLKGLGRSLDKTLGTGN